MKKIVLIGYSYWVFQSLFIFLQVSYFLDSSFTKVNFFIYSFIYLNVCYLMLTPRAWVWLIQVFFSFEVKFGETYVYPKTENCSLFNHLHENHSVSNRLLFIQQALFCIEIKFRALILMIVFLYISISNKHIKFFKK